MLRIMLTTTALLVGSFAFAETNTPFEPGESVRVVTRTKVITGRLATAPNESWVAVLEGGAASPTMIRLDSVEAVARAPEPLRVERREAFPHALESAAPGRWVLRSKHFIYGMPQLTRSFDFQPDGFDEEQPGISVLVREGFAVGHFDRMKAPLWVSMRWTRDDLRRSADLPTLGRDFAPDRELPEYARADTSYSGNQTLMDRGHLARHADNRAWGIDNSSAGCLMSNILPQRRNLQRVGRPWNDLEDEHRSIVGREGFDADTIWIISGAVYENGETYSDDRQDGRIGDSEVGVPHGCFKIIAWVAGDELQVRGYLFHQTDRDRDLTRYLRPIDVIEELTGIDVFPDLPEEEQSILESAEHLTLWGE